MIKILKTSKDNYDIIYAISALGKLKAKSAVNILLKYIDSRNSEIANGAIYALGEIGDKSAIPYLEKKMNSPNFESHTNELKTRFLENSKRGENIHEREEAIFNLDILNNPTVALELAQKNWEKQKEPIDARIFLRSAIAANKKNAAKPVIEFINQTMIEDIYLNNLVEEIKGISK